MEKLTQQEEDVMCKVWSIGSCFIRDILAQYKEPKPPYTTLASIVKNLERKKFLRSKLFGNTYRYTPLIKQEEYKKYFMKGFVANYFKNSYKELVSFFAKEEKISPEELKEIIGMIEKRKK